MVVVVECRMPPSATTTRTGLTQSCWWRWQLLGSFSVASFRAFCRSCLCQTLLGYREKNTASVRSAESPSSQPADVGDGSKPDMGIWQSQRKPFLLYF
ncbi:unnamed protein product [Heligmosomoides polygyrus]|uniref:Secreted protein n=1 Tax=Heligmosomoides polygyrus TaxID=6339 RepID=A0A183FHI9_HELPZ|nr:unnamed protein product [Heligmosomoides polygyrus]